MALKDTSRYLLGDIIEVRDAISGNFTQPAFVDIHERVSDFSPTDRIVNYDESLSWAGLGAAFLRDGRGWWVIADLSNVVDPFSELVAGRKLRVPTVSRFALDILPSKRGV